MRARSRTSDEYINFLDSIGVVTNKTEAISYLASRTGVKDTTIRKELSKINGDAETAVRKYYTIDGEECEENTAYVHYMLVDTGRVHKDTGEQLYFAFFKRGNEWNGCFVNTLSEFFGNAEAYYGRVVTEETKTEIKGVPNVTIGDAVNSPFMLSVVGDLKSTGNEIKSVEAHVSGEFVLDEVPPEVTRRIEPILEYVKEVCNSEHWVFDNEQQLFRYLYSVNNKVLRIVETIKKRGSSDNHVVFNKDKTHVLFNTGVRTRLGKNIYVVGKLFGEESRFCALEVLRCRDCLGVRDFDLTVAENLPKPIEMFKSDSDLIFHGDLFDVDIENTTYLEHILIERMSRLPQYMQEMELKQRRDELIRRVGLAFDRQNVDKTYFKPFFSYKDDSIGFLIPLYEDDITINNLEFAVVLVKSKSGFWITPTVLNSQQAARSVRQLLPFSRI